MLTGKYWITPEGVVDVTTNEHALYARKILLGLSPEDYRYQFPQMFNALSPAEIDEFRGRGVSEEILEFLSKRNDPRVFAIRHWNWIRTRKHQFYLWEIDEQALLTIKNAADYWAAQRQALDIDSVELIEIASDLTQLTSVGLLRK